MDKSHLNGASSRLDSSEVSEGRTASPSLRIAQIAVLSGVVAVGTILTNLLFSFTLPSPLSEITAAPAFYLAIAVLYPRKVSFWSTAVGSFVGEMLNIFVFNEAAAIFALTFVPGIVIARAPETLLVWRFRTRTIRWIISAMIIATVLESVVFFLIDWPVYSFTLFYGCSNTSCSPLGLSGGFYLAALDFGTMIDLVWIPVALILVRAVRRAFNVEYFN